MTNIDTTLFDYSLPFYKVVQPDDPISYSIHFGFWESDTKSIREAWENTNVFLAKHSQIRPTHYILDVGCGLGATAIWLAQNKGVQVAGVTISKKEIAKAKELAEKFAVTHKTMFMAADFMDLNLPDHSFDHIWAIESMSYADDKLRFAEEIYRLLKFGGTFMVADALLARNPDSDTKKKQAELYKRGFSVPEIAVKETFIQNLRHAGFKKIKMWDKTEAIMPSSRSMRSMSAISAVFTSLGVFLGLIPKIVKYNAQATKVQNEMFISGILEYLVIKAEK